MLPLPRVSTRTCVLLVLLCATVTAGCRAPAASGSAGPREPLSMWSHGGTDAEQAALQEQVEQWNASGAGAPVELRIILEGDYGQVVQAATTSRTLPDILEVDGPLVSSYAYQGAIVPLEGTLPEELVQGLLPSLVTQGTYDGELYAVGGFESGLGLYADRSRLLAAGVRVPQDASDAWTAAEFGEVLGRLAASDPDGKVLDLKRNYGVGEWLTYAFTPLLWSAGTDLIDRDDLTADGVLNSSAAVGALTTLAGWQSYVDPNAEDTSFVDRDVALSWSGHWTYNDYAAALGDDLVLLPLPDLGSGSRSSQGSWAWALSDGRRTDEAAEVLQHLLRDEAVVQTTTANGGVPGTRTALAADRRFASDGALHTFASALVRTCGDQPTAAGCVAVARPRTPGYATVSYAFAQAVDAVLHGADPRAALDDAVALIDSDTASHDGYRQAS